MLPGSPFSLFPLSSPFPPLAVFCLSPPLFFPFIVNPVLNYVQNATFEWDFVGIPGGNQAMVMDVMVVSKTTAHMEEARGLTEYTALPKSNELR